MKNKVLVKLCVPELDYEFDCFIPVNEIIWKVKKLLIKSVSDLTGGSMDMNSKCVLINKKSNKIYENNKTIYETDIRNTTELILLTVKN